MDSGKASGEGDYPYAPPQPGFYPSVNPNDPPPPYPGAYSPAYKPDDASAPPMGAAPMYMAQPPQQVITVVQVQTPGPYPYPTQCRNCRQHVTTRANAVPGALTYLLSGIICLLGCWMGCCLIPCCVPELQNVEHYCPNCKQIISVHKRM